MHLGRPHKPSTAEIYSMNIFICFSLHRQINAWARRIDHGFHWRWERASMDQTLLPHQPRKKWWTQIGNRDLYPTRVQNLYLYPTLNESPEPKLKPKQRTWAWEKSRPKYLYIDITCILSTPPSIPKLQDQYWAMAFYMLNINDKNTYINWFFHI